MCFFFKFLRDFIRSRAERNTYNSTIFIVDEKSDIKQAERVEGAAVVAGRCVAGQGEKRGQS